MIKYFLFLGILFLGVNCSAQPSNSKVLNQTEFKKQIKSSRDIQLIDVRTPDEFHNGHIANAENINYMSHSFKTNLERLDKNKAVYVYCHSGGRSAKAANVLVKAGFKKVYDLKGGYSAWKK